MDISWMSIGQKVQEINGGRVWDITDCPDTLASRVLEQTIRIADEGGDCCMSVMDFLQQFEPVHGIHYCGGLLHYEVLGVTGMRLSRKDDDGKTFYKYRCSECGVEGTNNGQAKYCRKPKR